MMSSLSKAKSQHYVNDSLDVVLFNIKAESNKIEIAGISREFIYFDSKNDCHYLYKLKFASLGNPIENKKEIPIMEFEYEKENSKKPPRSQHDDRAGASTPEPPRSQPPVANWSPAYQSPSPNPAHFSRRRCS